ncbi:adenosine kinase isoform X2 [Cephus cinctus]|uniref:Adenosine kinase n=1 Tax=Cephus cinctus TaxID=211228 RepID=A0AAJ7FUK9_CEPCN|nr:adenosine kinase isoform X2 [Cephus cinctus]
MPAEQTISAGGSAQNTLRILQWLCGGPSSSPVGIYYGGIGKDARGNMLESLVRAAGVDTRYAVHPTLPTGVCVSLITGSSRSLAANIGAAGVYTLDDVIRCKFPRDAIKIVYIEGFFVTHSLDVAKQLVELTRDTKIISAFNLNGVYIFQDHHDAIFEMVGLAKIVFGNAREMIALAQALDLKFDDVTDIPFLLNNLKRVTVGVSSLSNKDWLSDEGVFIMTQGGSSPAIAVWGQGQSVQVQPITPKNPVVDTTGAGDALVAGFLAGVLAGWDPKNCLEYGCKVASFMVTRLGVTLSNLVPPDLLQ